MARYIDADEFIKRIRVSPAFKNKGWDGYFLRDVVIDLLRNVPTADVVPKSEVERLRFNLEAVLEEIPETKREVAREIFEDIRNTCGYSVVEHGGVVIYHTKCYSIMATKLDELEKKYT